MIRHVAHGGDTARAGDCVIGYALEDADGRFVPGLTEDVVLVSPDGNELGPYRHDEPNGLRYREAVDVEFAKVPGKRGADHVEAPGPRA